MMEASFELMRKTVRELNAKSGAEAVAAT